MRECEMMRKRKGKITMELTYNKSSSRYKVSGTGEGKRHTTEGVGVSERKRERYHTDGERRKSNHTQTNKQSDKQKDR